MDRAFDFIQEEIIGTTDDDCLGCCAFHAFEEHVFPVSNAAFFDELALTEVLSIVGLITLEVSERGHNSSTSVVSDTAEISLVNAPDGNNTGLDEVLQSKVVNTTGAEDNIGTGGDNLLAALFANVHLSLSDLVKVIGVLNEDLDAHLESELVEVEVDEGDLAVLEDLGHTLRATGSLDRVSIDEGRLFAGLTVGLEEMDCLDVALGLAVFVGFLHVLHGLDDHVCKEFTFGSEKFGAHGSLCRLNKGIVTKGVGLDGKSLLNMFHGLFEGKTISSHDGGRVHLVLHKFVGTLEELSGEDDDGCSSITDLTVLDLTQLDQNFGSGVGHLKLLENGSAIVGDSDITDVVNKHFIEALRSETALNDVGETGNSEDVLRAHILALFTLSEDSDLCHSDLFFLERI